MNEIYLTGFEYISYFWRRYIRTRLNTSLVLQNCSFSFITFFQLSVFILMLKFMTSLFDHLTSFFYLTYLSFLCFTTYSFVFLRCKSLSLSLSNRIVKPSTMHKSGDIIIYYLYHAKFIQVNNHVNYESRVNFCHSLFSNYLFIIYFLQ